MWALEYSRVKKPRFSADLGVDLLRYHLGSEEVARIRGKAYMSAGVKEWGGEE